LALIAKRIQENIRKYDIVARVGGDEFTLLLEGIQSSENVDSIISQVTKSIEAPLIVHNLKFYIHPSVGIRIFPQDDPNPETILQNAGFAMYAAKRNPETNLVFFHQIRDKSSNVPLKQSAP
jgi:diguanylate cyclase (GGDEF)-like protein